MSLIIFLGFRGLLFPFRRRGCGDSTIYLMASSLGFGFNILRFKVWLDLGFAGLQVRFRMFPGCPAHVYSSGSEYNNGSGFTNIRH